MGLVSLKFKSTDGSCVSKTTFESGPKPDAGGRHTGNPPALLLTPNTVLTQIKLSVQRSAEVAVLVRGQLLLWHR